MQMKFYYNNKLNYEYKMKQQGYGARFYHIKNNGEAYFYLYPFGDLIQRSFHMPIVQGMFFQNFLKYK